MSISNNNSKNVFLSPFLENILEFSRLPKFQAERVIGSILGIYIKSLLEEYFKQNVNSFGELTFIAPEFPLKKDGKNQSNNIDFLLLDRKEKTVIFVELKTGLSLNVNQLKRYCELKNSVENNGAQFLYDNLFNIRDNSKEFKKYEYLLNIVKDFKEDFYNSRKMLILYIAPKELSVSLMQRNGFKPDYTVSFSELPDVIYGPGSYDWREIKQFLQQFDYIGRNGSVSPKEMSSCLEHKLIYPELCKKIYERLINSTIVPKQIRFGMNRKFPKYQVEFKDGTVKPFNHNGTEYTRTNKFKDSNLGEPVCWETLCNVFKL